MRRNLTSFEKWCLYREILDRRKLKMPLAEGVLIRDSEKTVIRIAEAPWHPNAIEIYGRNREEIERDAPELFLHRVFFDSHGVMIITPKNELPIKKLHEKMELWDREQRRENVSKYLKSLKQREEFVSKIGQEEK